MAISRPFLLALVGLVLLGATVFAVNNARNSGDDGPAPVAKSPDQATPAPTPAPEPAQASGKLSARDAVASILSPAKPVDSARFSISYDARELEGDREHEYGSIEGTYVAKGETQLPDFDIRVRNHSEGPGGPKNTDLRAVLANGKPFVGDADGMYAGPADDIEGTGKTRSAIASSPIATAPALDLNPWLRDLKVQGVEKVDGVDATHVAGDLALPVAAADLIGLVRREKRDSGAQSNVVDVPANWRKNVKNSVESARLDAWVGADKIVRRLTLAVKLDIPPALADVADRGRATARVDVRLSDVNEVDSVATPSDVSSEPAAKGMGARDAKSARNVLVLSGLEVDAPGGVLGGSYAFLRLARLGASDNVAKKVLRTADQHKPVVVFFRNPVGLDDKATAESVSYLKSHAKKLAVYTDNVENAKSYGQLLEHLGVTQAPAIVFINRRGKASLVEGYVDGPSLVQVVADAR
jgi:hypothetical protein